MWNVKSTQPVDHLPTMDRKSITFHPQEISPSLSLEQYFPMTKRQGNIGSCLAFCVVSVVEFIMRQARVLKVDEDLSEKFLYFIARHLSSIDETRGDTGITIEEVMEAAHQIGICRETYFPYYTFLNRFFGYADSSEEPPTECYDDAVNFRIGQYGTLSKSQPGELLDNIRMSIASQIPVIISFLGEDDTFPLTSILYTGIVQKTQSVSPWRHAVVVVGYDDEKKMIKFRNTWDGPIMHWGDHGHGYIRYEDVDDIVVNGWICVGLRLRDDDAQYQVNLENVGFSQRALQLSRCMSKLISSE